MALFTSAIDVLQTLVIALGAGLGIEVHHAEKIDGVKTQKLKIHYNCVGSIEASNILPLPQPEVLIQTRKGVAVSYSQSQQVMNL